MENISVFNTQNGPYRSGIPAPISKNVPLKGLNVEIHL